MSHYADWILEREGNHTIETEFGFIEYGFRPACWIEGIYVAPEFRKQGKGRELAERVVALAKERGITLLWARVNILYLNATESLKACLAYGFKLHSLDGAYIIMTKDIGG